MLYSSETIVSISLALLVAGCSSSSSNDAEGTSSALDLSIGAKTTTESGNGLPFAETGDDVNTSFGLPQSGRMVRFVTSSNGSTTTLEEVDVVLDFVSPSGELDNGTITIDGEDMNFDLGEATFNGELFFNGDSATGVNSRLITVFSYSGAETQGYMVGGVETSPADVAAQGGTVTYVGGIEGFGTLVDETGAQTESRVRLIGDIELVAAFNSGRVTGRTAIVAEGTTPIEVETDLGQTTIDLNGFQMSNSGTADCGAGTTCNADIQIGAAFYGPDADEISGIASVDVTQTTTATGDVSQIKGATGFTAVR